MLESLRDRAPSDMSQEVLVAEAMQAMPSWLPLPPSSAMAPCCIPATSRVARIFWNLICSAMCSHCST